MNSFPQIPFAIGHRGSPQNAPENTLASFRQAYADGFSWVEFDVSITVDGFPVVFHDDVINRTTDGSGLLEETTNADLRKLSAGNWFATTFENEQVPILAEVLDLLSSLNMGFNIELKASTRRDKIVAVEALKCIQSCWPNGLAPPLVSSFSTNSLLTSLTEAPYLVRSMLYEDLAKDWKETGRQLQVSAFGLDDSRISPDTVRKVKDEGYRVMVYTVNDMVRAREIKQWGVDHIFTDNPALANI